MRILFATLAVVPLLISPCEAAKVQAAPSAEARLAAAWLALHPRKPQPPACPHPDPVRETMADFDATVPGLETALASLRFGVVLLSAKGQPLASLALECGAANQANTKLHSEVIELRPLRASGLSPQDLLLRSRQLGRCGSLGWWQLFRLHGAALETLLSTEEDVERSCGSAPYEKWTAQISVPAVGSIRAVVDGIIRQPREDGSYGPAEPLHKSTLYRLLPSGKFGCCQ